MYNNLARIVVVCLIIFIIIISFTGVYTCNIVSVVTTILNSQHLVTTEGETLLPQYLGTYRLTVNNAETYWIVMRSIFSSTIKMHKKFDLKGSTVDRQASTKEKV